MAEKPYFQTWGWACDLKKVPVAGRWLYGQVQAFCGWVTGHEWSDTERGYHGTDMVDVWCRWCNFHTEIPLIEMPDSEYLKWLYELDQAEE